MLHLVAHFWSKVKENNQDFKWFTTPWGLNEWKNARVGQYNLNSILHPLILILVKQQGFTCVYFPSGLPDDDNSAHILKSMLALFWLFAQL